MRSFLFISLAVLFVSVQTSAQKKVLNTISENDLKAHLEFIASDLMQGRDFFTEIPGLEITANYLEAQCEKMKLKPGFNDFNQFFDMVSERPDSSNTIFRLRDTLGNTSYESKNIFSFGGDSNNDTIRGEIVFAGYGWYNEKNGYNDTENINLKGKVVVVMTRTPELVREGKESEIEIEMKKMARALMGGAKALVMVTDPLHPNPEFIESIRKYVKGGRFKLKDSPGKRYVPIRLVFANEQLANEILKESGKTLTQLQKEITENSKPVSFVVKEASAEIQLVNTISEVKGRNVIGVVEGSDPILKNECILFTAHYDHVGVTSNGEVNYGADDNGSGTVALLEIAEAFQNLKKKPKRSIVFAWVTAEEKGLIGSDYYSKNPVISLENTVANINLDMVGRSGKEEPGKDDTLNKGLAGQDGIYIVSGKQSSELLELSKQICEKVELIPHNDLSNVFLSRSDQYNFYKNGVPVLGISTGMHDDYHKPSDSLEKIDYKKMKRIAQYCFLLANQIANQKDRISIDNPVKK